MIKRTRVLRAQECVTGKLASNYNLECKWLEA